MNASEGQAGRFAICPLHREQWDQVAQLVHDSTNAWYRAQGRPEIFAAGPASTRLFCEVYESLDPGCCLIAHDQQRDVVAGSCFYHPRPSHVSLGIMNVHPDYFGQGVARLLLTAVTQIADDLALPTRLVSSALNLDSFSLYNRAGFIPRTFYQDMLLTVPAAGLPTRDARPTRIRPATLDDVDEMERLERQLVGLCRARDFRFCCENQHEIWQTYVAESAAGGMDGFLTSIRHPASNLLGPGVMRDQHVAIALVHAALDGHHRDNRLVVVTPSDATQLVAALYAWGARNCELHVGQVRGAYQPPTGVVIPTFMPETG